MYKYEFETISSSFSGWSLIAGNVYDTENYMDLIIEHSRHLEKCGIPASTLQLIY